MVDVFKSAVLMFLSCILMNLFLVTGYLHVGEGPKMVYYFVGGLLMVFVCMYPVVVEVLWGDE